MRLAALGAVVIAGLLGLGFGSPTVNSRLQATCLAGPQSAVLVKYTRTGGFIGSNDRVTVLRNGQTTVTRRPGRPGGSGALPCRQLRQLRDLLVAARFPTLQREYLPEVTVSDGFIETTTYRGKAVRVLTDARVPARLERVLRLLRGLVSER